MTTIDIVERLRFDAARCEATFSKGVAGNITEAAAEIERLRAALGFYASPDSWNKDVDGLGPLLPREGGKRAGEALNQQERKPT